MNFLKIYWDKVLLLIASSFIIYIAIFSQVDIKTDERIQKSFKQAIGVFASAKALNAVISLVQGTEIGPPGVNITIGEVLDPINDLVEQFSWVMLAALSSLGIQKILMNIVTCNGFDMILIIAVLGANVLYFYKDKFRGKLLFKFAVILVFLRFCLPFMSYANDYIYINYIAQEYNIEKSENIVKDTQSNIASFDESKSSLFSTKYYTQKMDQFEKVLDNASGHIVELIIVFLFQTMLFPLLFLFLLYKFIIQLFNFY